MAHTPGPWTIAWEDDDGDPFDNGVRIDAPEGPVAFNVIDCSAILIAAAPEMLAALRLADNALDYAQAQVDSERDAAALRSWRRDVQRAIASAVGTGETPVRQ